MHFDLFCSALCFKGLCGRVVVVFGVGGVNADECDNREKDIEGDV
jgi:hypothetical protein